MLLAIHCKGCFNPETWSFEGGKDFTLETESQLYKLLDKPYITRFSILGGEPLAPQHVKEINKLIKTIRKKYPNIKIWVWTGYTFEDLCSLIKNAEEQQFPPCPGTDVNQIFNNIDYLVAGPFIQEEKDLTLAWRGSRNQQVFDVQKTLEQGEKILYVS